MDSTFTFTATDLLAAREWTHFQLASWGVKSPYVDLWLAEAACRITPAGGTARVVLDYDTGEQVLALDAWCGEARVYGIEDPL